MQVRPGLPFNSRTISFVAKSKTVRKTAGAGRSGRMAPFTRGTGSRTPSTVTAELCTSPKIITRDNGAITRLKDVASTSPKTGGSIKDVGSSTGHRGLERKYGWT